LTVIASEAKQSNPEQPANLECFVATAPRKDGIGIHKQKGRFAGRPLSVSNRNVGTKRRQAL
jgi:hypothetical protein